jgi:DNA-binding CsgD family transcriptional regulator
MSNALNALTHAALLQPVGLLGTPTPSSSSFSKSVPSPLLGLDPATVFVAMLDEIEHAMLVVDGMTILHANRAARHELDANNHAEYPLVVHTMGHQRQLIARRKSDATALENAVFSAAGKGTRKLLMLGMGDHRTSLAVVPLDKTAAANPSGTVLLMLGKRRVCSELPIYWYARNFALTQAEASVLQGLCKGKTPNEIAADHSVAISTVRTQLAAIRTKTHTQSLRELVNEVACLPPLVHALTGVVTH